jgi:hypothetical protein
MQFSVKASKEMGVIALGPFDTRAALHKALELRDEGYTNIRLTNWDTGDEFDIEQFMRDRPDA